MMEVGGRNKKGFLRTDVIGVASLIFENKKNADGSLSLGIQKNRTYL